MAVHYRVQLGDGHWTATRAFILNAELTDADVPHAAWGAFAADVAVVLSTGFVSRSDAVVRVLGDRSWELLRLAKANAIAGRPGPIDSSPQARSLYALERFAFGAPGAARLLRWPVTVSSRLDLAYALHENELGDLAEPVRERLRNDVRAWRMLIGTSDATAELSARLDRANRRSTYLPGGVAVRE